MPRAAGAGLPVLSFAVDVRAACFDDVGDDAAAEDDDDDDGDSSGTFNPTRTVNPKP